MAIKTRYTEEVIAEYTQEGYWSDHELMVDHIDRHAREMPDREALVDNRGRYTWADLRRAIDRVALGLLDLGIQKQDRIVAQLPNWVEYFYLRFGLQRIGALPLFPMMTYRAKELEQIVRSVDARAIVVAGTFNKFNYAEMALELKSRLPGLQHVLVLGPDVPPGAISMDELVRTPLEQSRPADYLTQFRPGPNDPHQMMVTSGTTGLPKFGINTGNGNMRMGKTSGERIRLTQDDVLFAIAPIPGGPSATICGSAAPYYGTKVVLLEKFDAEDALRLIERERITVATLVPTQMVKMLAVPNFEQYDLSSLRAVAYGGSTLPPELAKEINERMKARILTVYGMTDAGVCATTDFLEPIEVQNRTVGRPLPGNEVKLVNDDGHDVPTGQAGEIWWRGPGCSAGYFNDPEATRAAWSEDGWFHTGDMGTLDENGYLSIVGRKKDVIIRGGQNIVPREVEDLLMTHPKVAEVAVVAMPDPVMVEKACAYVLPRPGQTFTFEEMIAHLRAKNMAAFKLPERLEVVESFPMAGGGQKIAKNLLREDIAAKLKAEGKI